MPEYLAPGVYVEEIPSGNRPIQAASTSTAGMVGMTARGPVNRPTLVTSRGGFERIFGGKLHPDVFTEGRDALPYAAEGFFTNGGARLYVVRVVGTGAQEARTKLVVAKPPDGAERKLAKAASGGDELLFLDGDAAAPPAGAQLLIGDGATAEVVTVTGGFGVRVVRPGLGTTFPAGAAVTVQTPTDLPGTTTGAVAVDQTELELTETTDIQADAVLLLRDTSGDVSKHEVVAVKEVDPGTNRVTLKDPVRFDHEPQSTLATLADGPQATQLSAEVTAGSAPAFLRLADPTGADVGAVVRLSDGGGAEEHAVVTAVATGVTTSPVTESHPPDTLLRSISLHMTVHAHWPGEWGDALRVTVAPDSIAETTTKDPADASDTGLSLTSVVGVYPGSVLVLDDASGVLRAQVTAVDSSTGMVTLAGPPGRALPAGTTVTTQEFTLAVDRMENGRAAESERFERLSVGDKHPRYAPRIVGSWADNRPSDSGESLLVRLTDDAPGGDKLLPFPKVSRYLSGGFDDVATVDDATYEGQASPDPEDRTGIQALMNEPVISIVAVPGRTSLELQQALVTHCDDMRYRFAVLDVPAAAKLEDAKRHRRNFDTTRAALYYPDVVVADPFGAPGERRAVSPSGHVMGVYARTDLTRGVHKVPANEVVSGALALRTSLTKGEQDILNPINLNCLRDFRAENRGLRVYGGRVATSDPEWTYVNVRRLLLFIEQSLDNGLQWAVFEPNEKPLWDAVRQSITGFLDTVWRSGALQGAKQEEAFYVNVGYDVTMSQTDIDNGRLIVEVGVAPVKPAEFVIVRISQKTREAVA